MALRHHTLIWHSGGAVDEAMQLLNLCDAYAEGQSGSELGVASPGAGGPAVRQPSGKGPPGRCTPRQCAPPVQRGVPATHARAPAGWRAQRAQQRGTCLAEGGCPQEGAHRISRPNDSAAEIDAAQQCVLWVMAVCFVYVRQCSPLHAPSEQAQRCRKICLQDDVVISLLLDTSPKT